MANEENHDHQNQNKENHDQHAESAAHGEHGEPKGAKDEPIITETYYADDSNAHESADWGEPRNFVQTMCDSLIKKVPLDVLHHLNNSQKELIKAGIALGENRLRKAEKNMQRAKDLHGKDS
ncbi:MAG: hypothetical protein ACFCU1_07790 [Sumerlaeia bacterium]